jgi:thioredoxin 1
LAALVRQYPVVKVIKVEDGKGKPLGRSFGVKLWPTLVFLRDGRMVQQVARPGRAEMERAFKEIAEGGGRRLRGGALE